jgi:hypothetical protein
MLTLRRRGYFEPRWAPSWHFRADLGSPKGVVLFGRPRHGPTSTARGPVAPCHHVRDVFLGDFPGDNSTKGAHASPCL